MYLPQSISTRYWPKSVWSSWRGRSPVTLPQKIRIAWHYKPFTKNSSVMGWGGLSNVWKCKVVKNMSNMCPIAHVPYHPCMPSRSIHYYAQFQKDPWTISQDPCRTGMHPCTHLDILGVSQNLFSTTRYMVSSNAMKKNYPVTGWGGLSNVWKCCQKLLKNVKYVPHCPSPLSDI